MESRTDTLRENARVGYDKAVDLWIYMGTSTWNRFSILILSNTVFLSGVAAILASKDGPALLALTLCAIGLVVSFVFSSQVKRDFDYHDYYVHSARRLEALLEPVETAVRGGRLNERGHVWVWDGQTSRRIPDRGNTPRLRARSAAEITLWSFCGAYGVALVVSFLRLLEELPKGTAVSWPDNWIDLGTLIVLAVTLLAIILYTAETRRLREATQGLLDEQKLSRELTYKPEVALWSAPQAMEPGHIRVSLENLGGGPAMQVEVRCWWHDVFYHGRGVAVLAPHEKREFHCPKVEGVAPPTADAAASSDDLVLLITWTDVQDHVKSRQETVTKDRLRDYR